MQSVLVALGVRRSGAERPQQQLLPNMPLLLLLLLLFNISTRTRAQSSFAQTFQCIIYVLLILLSGNGWKIELIFWPQATTNVQFHQAHTSSLTLYWPYMYIPQSECCCVNLMLFAWLVSTMQCIADAEQSMRRACEGACMACAHIQCRSNWIDMAIYLRRGTRVLSPSPPLSLSLANKTCMYYY